MTNWKNASIPAVRNGMKLFNFLTRIPKEFARRLNAYRFRYKRGNFVLVPIATKGPCSVIKIISIYATLNSWKEEGRRSGFVETSMETESRLRLRIDRIILNGTFRLSSLVYCAVKVFSFRRTKWNYLNNIINWSENMSERNMFTI